MAEVNKTPEPGDKWRASARELLEALPTVEGIAWRKDDDWGAVVGRRVRFWRNSRTLLRCAELLAEFGNDDCCLDQGEHIFTRAQILSPVAKPEPGGELCEACGIIGEEREPLLTWAGDCEGALCCGDCLNRYRASEITDRIRSRRQQQKQSEQGVRGLFGVHRTPATFTDADGVERLSGKRIEKLSAGRAQELLDHMFGRGEAAHDPYTHHPKRPTIDGLPATEADIALLTAEADAAAFDKLSASQRRERARREREPMKRETSNPHWLEAWSSPAYESDH